MGPATAAANNSLADRISASLAPSDAGNERGSRLKSFAEQERNFKHSSLLAAVRSVKSSATDVRESKEEWDAGTAEEKKKRNSKHSTAADERRRKHKKRCRSALILAIDGDNWSRGEKKPGLGLTVVHKLANEDSPFVPYFSVSKRRVEPRRTSLMKLPTRWRLSTLACAVVLPVLVISADTVKAF
jgi:hypothetical protein